MMNNTFDVAVIGGGPGGYVAAIKAAQLGKNVVLIEREHLGGICLNWGCIPTKALLQSADRLQQIKEAKSYGICVNGVSFDFQAIIARSRKVSKNLSAGIRHLLKKNQVSVIEGYATLESANRIQVANKASGSQSVGADHIILATGARARSVPSLKIDRDRVWSYKEALVPSELPKSLLVVGSGAIGMEFASFFHKLGSNVTVIEMLPRILPHEDEEVSDYVRKSMSKQGVTIHTSCKLASISKNDRGVTATIEANGQQETLTYDRVISAVGVVPNSEELGLESCGIALDEKGFIRTDNQCRTNVPNIFAIGDVAGVPCLAHKASHEGNLVAEVICGTAGHNTKPSAESIPACTYSHPQVASIGLTEQQAKAKNMNIRIGRFPYSASGMAIALGKPEGFIKTIFDASSGELLGAHMVGAGVTEMIQGFGIAKSLETTAEELMHTVFSHPTLSEMMHEAVLDAYDKAIHI